MARTYIHKVALIHIRDKKVLMARSKGKDLWFLPGGKQEGNEMDHEILIREIKEELGVNIDPASICYYGFFEAQAHGKPKGTFVGMHCYTASFEGVPTPNAEIEEVAYFSYSQKNSTSLVDHLIFDDLKVKSLIS